MRRSFLSLVAVACLAIAAVGRSIVESAAAVFRVTIDCLAEPFRLIGELVVVDLDRPALAYASPSDRFLRHEAGVSRRAAARHV